MEPTEAGRVRIFLRGMLQGMGFRPFIYNVAKSMGLKGWVRNLPQGVLVKRKGSFPRSRILSGASDKRLHLRRVCRKWNPAFSNHRVMKHSPSYPAKDRKDPPRSSCPISRLAAIVLKKFLIPITVAIFILSLTVSVAVPGTALSSRFPMTGSARV